MLIALCALLVAVPLSADVLLDDFEDGDTPGWAIVGDGGFMQDYRLAGVSGGCDSTFSLLVTMAGARGWCGVSAPLPAGGLAGCTAIRLDARGTGQCAELCVDVHQSDGARWWSIFPLPRDGSWAHIEAPAERFFAIQNPHHAPSPDFAKLQALWLSVRRPEGGGEGPAELYLDNVGLVGLTPQTVPALPSGQLTPVDLAGVSVVLADTGALPGLGQQAGAVAATKQALARAGAQVATVTPGDLGELDAQPGTILLWEGPACRDTDWQQVQRVLSSGGVLVWWGAGEPFSRPVDGLGNALQQTSAPSQLLTQGTWEGVHPLQAETPWRLTEAARALWPDVSAELPAGKCRFLTTNDSIRLQNHWSWVEMVPLLTVGYTARNWIGADDSFTGSVVTLLRHRGGSFGGARVVLAAVGSSELSTLSPDNPAFAQTLTGLVKAAAEPVALLPEQGTPRPTPVRRSEFLEHPDGVLGALDFGVQSWSAPEVVEATRRLGMNVLVAGVPWRAEPDAQGDVIDWTVADRLVADAEAGGWAVVFDPYCFGYARLTWATESDGPQAAPASIHNPRFLARFSDAMARLAARYADKPSVVALFATPDTGTSAFYVDTTPLGCEAWSKYAAARGLPQEAPTPPAQGELDLSPQRAAYIEFWWSAYEAFMRHVIEAIRTEAPDMPLLLRGPYLDVAPSFRLAAQFPDVAPHCECIETSIDVESTLRGFSARYGVAISGENGWPKERGAPLAMAAATTLLGGYRTWLYSFGGPLWARPGLSEFERLQRVWPSLAGAQYVAGDVGLLIPDATIWASQPPNFFSAEGRPHLEPLMERSGYGFQAVSAQWPRLDGLRVLMDDGRNDVLPQSSRREIAQWVRDGGTLVALPQSGRFDAAGSGDTLASELGIDPVPGRAQVGRGRVITLPTVPTDEGELADLLLELCGPPAVEVTPRVNRAVFVRDGRTYIVLYNKSTDLVGAFFRESRLPAAVHALPDLELTVRLPGSARSARELVTGETLGVSDGAARVALPATEYRVLELDR